MNVKAEIKGLLRQGVYHQEEIFKRLYPRFPGHYSRLRDNIAEVKNNA